MGNGKLKKVIFLAVTVMVIANLLLDTVVSAKKLEITEKDVGTIKNGLDLMKLLMNLSVDDSKLKTVLNTVLSGGKTGTDVTYGLLVLTSLNEMEFIDLVVSQRYKTEATEYFNNVLDERLSLVNYYKGIGYDLPRILAGKITSPIAALTLNTFDITDKAIAALSMIKVLEKEMKYDGLWVYFDQRRSNNSHEEAWELAETKLGGLTIKNQRRFGQETRGEKITQLESQFATLYDKWGPYTDEKGVKKEFRKQVNNELKNTIVSAVEDYKLAEAEKEVRISFWGSLKNKLAKLAKKVEKAGNSLKEEFVKINNKVKQLAGFGGAQISQVSNEALEAIETAKEVITEESIVEEIQELEKKVEEAPVVSEILPVDEPRVEEETEIKIEEVVKEELVESATTTEIIESETTKKEESVPGWCQKQTSAQAFKNSIIFSEIAWMGSKDSGNDEWIKLKNISGGDLDLAGWQISDKDQQIKIVFGDDVISPVKPLLLERTDDSSLPEAAADLVYTGALNDTDEELYLFDASCQLQDEVLANSVWPAGDKNNRWPMERNVDLSWRNQGGQAVIFNYGTPASVPPPPPPEPVVTKILISEIQTAPNGERFVELYNPNDQAVNLADWYIQRKTQTGSSFNSFVSSTHFAGKNIGSLGYFLISSSSQADIVLNLTLTEGNFLRLKNPDQEIIDEVDWENPAAGESWGRKWSTTTQEYLDTDNSQSDFEIQTPTPKAQNQSLVLSSNQAPSASFVYTPAGPFTAGQEVVFDSASSSDSDGTITSFIWDFGDSSLATTSQASTTHSFAAAGNFSVSLTVVDDDNATSSATTTAIIVADAEETPSLSVVINEIAWAGTKAHSSDEWIELYNNSGLSVDMTGWRLAAEDGTPAITFSTSTGNTIIPSGGYFLLERTNSSTTNVAEDYIYTGALNNEGEKLELRDNNNALIDLVDFSSGWPAGSSSPYYLSMERVNAAGSGTSSANWASNSLATRNGKDAGNKEIGGTPRAKNSVSYSSTTLSAYLFNEFPEVTLTSLGGPYVTEMNWVPSQATLILKEGVILKLKKQTGTNYTGYLEVNGKLVTEGTADNPVVITYFGDDEYGGDTDNNGTSTLPFAGNWRYLRFASTTATSTLDWTIVRYGGGNCEPGACWGAIWQRQGAGIEIRNSTIEKNVWGITSEENSCPATFDKIRLENTVFSQNERNIYRGSGEECELP